MQDFCEIVCIVDKSGSMSSVKSDTIGSLNSFLQDQKKVGDNANVSMVLFDDKYETLYEGVSISEAKELNNDNYRIGGCTALLDAVGKSVDSLGNRLNAMKESERPDKVIIVILTDGLENASREYSREQVKSMIEKQQSEYKWKFIFLSASMDSVNDCVSMGISAKNFKYFDKSAEGLSSNSQGLSNVTTVYRSCATFDTDAYDKVTQSND